MNITTEIRHRIKRSIHLFVNPKQEWEKVFSEQRSHSALFKSFLIPFAIVVSLLVLLIRLIYLPAWPAIGYALSNLTSTICGVFFTYLLIREYLTNKISDPDRISLLLTIYNAVFFIFFNSLSTAVNATFFSQLFGLLSVIFLRTLYTGIRSLDAFTPQNKSNLLIISGLSIICIPVIINKLLMIILHIPAFAL